MEERLSKEQRKSEQWSREMEGLSVELMEARREKRIPPEMVEQIRLVMEVCEEKDRLIQGLMQRIARI